MYIRYRTKDTHARIDCDRMAYHDKRILVLSCHGPQQTLRGLMAVLSSDVKTSIECYDDNDCPTALNRDGCGYRTYRHLLGAGLWQFLWVSKDPQLLVAGTEALGQALMSEVFTTPILPDWVPYLQKELERKELLAQLQGEECHSAYLSATTKDLDELVTQGIQSGQLKIV